VLFRSCWSGERFSFHGEHYHLNDVQFLPRPLQPQIPIWTAATWPVRAPFRRAVRFQGTWPLRRNPDGLSAPLTPDDVRGIAQLVAELRTEQGAAQGTEPAAPDPFDILVAGVTPAAEPARATDIAAEFAAAGATWWTERISALATLEEQRARIRSGPPRG
jgi:alkanesulfonate monooxygenase SsuD/methylene tetrahydromethanopterin reductase-like flavin-dependent oxidoreductase (luciferase family)